MPALQSETWEEKVVSLPGMKRDVTTGHDEQTASSGIRKSTVDGLPHRGTEVEHSLGTQENKERRDDSTTEGMADLQRDRTMLGSSALSEWQEKLYDAKASAQATEDRLRSDHKQVLAALEKRSNEETDNHRKEVMELQQELCRVQSNARNLLDQAKANHSAVQSALVERSRLDLQEYKAKADALQEHLHKAHKTSQVLSQRIEYLKQEQDEQQQKEELLSTALTASKDKYADLARETDKIKESLKSKMATVSEKNNEYRSQLTQLRERIEICDAKIIASDTELADVTEKHEKLEAKYKEAVEKHQQETCVFKTANNVLQTQLDKQTQAVTELIDETESLKDAIIQTKASAEETATVYANRIKILKAERAELRNNQKLLQQKLVTTVRSLDNMTLQQAEVIGSAINQDESHLEAIESSKRLAAEVESDAKTLAELKNEHDNLAASLQLVRADIEQREVNRERNLQGALAHSRSIKLMRNERIRLMENMVEQRAAISTIIRQELSDLPASVASDLSGLCKQHLSSFQEIKLFNGTCDSREAPPGNLKKQVKKLNLPLRQDRTDEGRQPEDDLLDELLEGTL